jgi:hypothetical protein
MKTNLEQLVSALLDDDLEPEPQRDLKPFGPGDLGTGAHYGLQGAEAPNGGKPLSGEVDLDDVGGIVVVDRNSVQVHVIGPKEEQLSYMLQTPFAQGRGIAATIQRTRPSIDRLVSQFGFQPI